MKTDEESPLTTPAEDRPGSTVVVGYAHGALGRAALAAAIAEARMHGDDLVVLNATRGDSYADPDFAGEEHLRELEAELAATGLGYCIEQRVGREPAGEVVAAISEHRARLVVIGLRRRSPVGKFLMGSTAQSILLDAPCSVLAVKV
jgi:nucleotide-binding universal stress UspA family protein